MKRIIIFTTLCCALYSVLAQNNLSLLEAEGIAQNYYKAIQLIISDPIGDGFIKGRQNLYTAFGKDMNGILKEGEMNIPDDINAILGNPYKDIRTANYLIKLSEFAHIYNFKFHYRIKKTEYLYRAEIKKKENVPLFTRVIIEKTLESPQIQGKKNINDTLFINVKTKGISLISNKYRTLRTYNNYSSTEEMLSEALNLYKEQRYDDASQLYYKILEKEPANGTASHQLGVMAFKGQAFKQYSQKIRDYIAEFYFQKTPDGQKILRDYFHKNIPCQKYTYDVKRFLYHRGEGKMIYNRRFVEMFETFLETSTTPIGRLDYKPFVCNRMPIYDKNTRSFGYINSMGHTIISPRYDIAYPFSSDGHTFVKTDNKWQQIDTLGNVWDVDLKKVSTTIDGSTFIVETENAGYVIVDRLTGEFRMFFTSKNKNLELIEIRDIKPYIDNYDGPTLFVCKDSGGEYGLYDAMSNELLPCNYSNMHVIDWNHKFAWVIVNYSEADFKRIESFKNGTDYNINYLDKFSPETWNNVGTIIKINL